MDEEDARSLWRTYVTYFFGANPLCKNYYEACLNENLIEIKNL